jgi:hypothetical protein
MSRLVVALNPNQEQRRDNNQLRYGRGVRPLSGRREMKLSRDELANCIIYQAGALKGFLEAEDVTLNHVKPHGALYGMAARTKPWPKPSAMLRIYSKPR